jgi:hypothetical protein
VRKKGKSFAKTVDRQAGLRAISMIKPLVESKTLALSLHIQMSLEAIAIGVGDATHYSNIAFALNIAMALAPNGLGDIGVIEAAQPSLVLCKQRWTETGVWNLDKSDVDKIAAAVEVYKANSIVSEGRKPALTLDFSVLLIALYRHLYRQKTSAFAGAEDALGLRGGYSSPSIVNYRREVEAHFKPVNAP